LCEVGREGGKARGRGLLCYKDEKRKHCQAASRVIHRSQYPPFLPPSLPLDAISEDPACLPALALLALVFGTLKSVGGFRKVRKEGRREGGRGGWVDGEVNIFIHRRREGGREGGREG